MTKPTRFERASLFVAVATSYVARTRVERRRYCNRTGFGDRLGMTANTTRTFQYRSHRVASPVAPFPWTPGTRHGVAELEWPPRGVTLVVDLVLPSSVPAPLSSLVVSLSYEVYDGIPLLSKWINVRLEGASQTDVVLDSVTVELFAAMPRFGAYIGHGSFQPGNDGEGSSTVGGPAPLLHAKTDQAHGAACAWTDDYDASADPIPGCDTCKDQGASEPLLSCAYEPYLYLPAGHGGLQAHSLGRGVALW